MKYSIPINLVNLVNPNPVNPVNLVNPDPNPVNPDPNHDLILAEKRSLYKVSVDLSEIQEPIANAPPLVKEIIERVLQTEKDKLYMKSPRNINDDVLKIIKEIVQ